MTHTAIAIDDKEVVLRELRKYLEPHERSLRLVSTARSGAEAIAEIRLHKPDVIFLDIDLGDMTGFDVLKAVQDLPLQVVFVTGSDDHARLAFDFNAIDYVSKPFGAGEVGRSVVRALERLGQGRRHEGIHTIIGSVMSNDMITIPNGSQYEVLHMDDIIHLEALEQYTRIVRRPDLEKALPKLVISRNIGQFEEYLTDDRFVRVHKSHIVNIKHIAKYVKGDGGEVLMADGKLIPVGRSRKEDLLRGLGLPS